MYLEYDNMHTNRIFNALICINNYVNSCTNCMLSQPPKWHVPDSGGEEAGAAGLHATGVGLGDVWSVANKRGESGQCLRRGRS